MLKNKNAYVYDNALRNVMRNKGRNALLGFMITAIVITTIVSLGIFQTTAGIIAEYKSRFSSEVTISPKHQQVSAGKEGNNNADGAIITPEQYLDFAESAYLDHSVIANYINCQSNTFTGIDQKEGYTGSTLRLLGNSWREFDGGQREMKDGRKPEADNECVISADLATLNNIPVGDSITMSGTLQNADGVPHKVVYTLSVVGIYIDTTDQYSMGQNARTPYLNKRNEVLTSYDTVMLQKNDGDFGVGINAVYFLKYPDDISLFEGEIRKKGLDESFHVKTDLETFKKLVTPVEGLNNISLVFVTIILAFGAAILILLSTIAIRERKYEIGVLRAMGMKKKKVSILLWGEMLIVTCICLVIGIAVGMLITQPVSDILLSFQATEAATQLSKVHVNIGVLTILEIIGITLALVSIAGVLSISKITKYEPIKILMNRD